MAYIKTIWEDRIVSTPNDVTLTKSGGGAIVSGDTVTAIASPTIVTKAGTPISADLLNKIEDAIYDSELISDSSLTSLSDITLEPTDSKGIIKDLSLTGRQIRNLLPEKVADGDTGGDAFFDIGIPGMILGLSGGFYNLTVPVSGFCFTSLNLAQDIVQGKYYLFSAYAKVANASHGNYKLGFSTNGTDVNKFSTPANNTDYVRVGVLVQPTDYDTATGFTFQFTGDGTLNAAFSLNFHSLMICEISSADYTAGVTTCLENYPYTSTNIDCGYVNLISNGKNIVDNKVTNFEKGRIDTATGTEEASSTRVRTANFIEVMNSTLYSISMSDIGTFYYCFEYDKDEIFIGYGSIPFGGNYTTSSTTRYIKIVMNINSGIAFEPDFARLKLQVELGNTITTYEDYKTPVIVSVNSTLKKVSDTIYDEYNVTKGEKYSRVSNSISLLGNNYTWKFNADATGYKVIEIDGTYPILAEKVSSQVAFKKFGRWSMNTLYSLTAKDQVKSTASGYGIISVSDLDSGWDESWNLATAFIDMTWAGLIKAYMNGWKMTTVSTQDLSCVWTGINSKTTQSGASGYAHVISTQDVGFSPYLAYYEKSTTVNTLVDKTLIDFKPAGSIIQIPTSIGYSHLISNFTLSGNTTAQAQQNTDTIINFQQRVELELNNLADTISLGGLI